MVKNRKERKSSPNPPPTSQPTSTHVDHIHSIAVHKLVQSSPLSANTKPQNYKGLYTVALLYLVVNILRLMLDNYLSFGILVQSPNIILHQKDISWAMISCLMQIVPIGMTFWTERVVMGMNRKLCNWIHFVVLGVCFVGTSVVSYFKIWQPLASFIPLLLSSIITLKLVSLICVNHENSKSDKKLTVGVFVYFLMAPTLCFQYEYPRSSHRSWTFLLKRIMEVVSALVGSYFVIFQYQGKL